MNKPFKDEDERRSKSDEEANTPPPRYSTVSQAFVVVAFLFTLGGSALTGFVGQKVYFETNTPKARKQAAFLRALTAENGPEEMEGLEPAEKLAVLLMRGKKLNEAQAQADKAALKTYRDRVIVSYLFLGGAVLGFLVIWLVALRIVPKLAALVFTAIFVAPGIFIPFALVFTSPFVVPALVALFVSTKKTSNVPKPSDAVD